MKKLLLMAFAFITLNIHAECTNFNVITSSYDNLQYSLNMLQLDSKTNNEEKLKTLKAEFKAIYRKQLTKKAVYKIIDKYEEMPEYELYYQCDGMMLKMKAYVLFDLMVTCGYYDYSLNY